MKANTIRAMLALPLMLGTIAGCSTIDRLGRIGEEPPLSPITNPVAQPDYQPVAVPLPQPEMASYKPNSLWRQDAQAFFDDQRASKVGDILTVNIDITDSAALTNSTSRTRSSGEDADLTNFFGIEAGLGTVFNDAINPASVASFGSDSSSAGEGTIDRKEDVKLTVAAMIVQALPNGNFVIMGRQEVRVNYETRQLHITGIVRPEDISSENTVAHEQIAEARISYGGVGHLSELQQPRWGQQLYEILFPY